MVINIPTRDSLEDDLREEVAHTAAHGTIEWRPGGGGAVMAVHSTGRVEGRIELTEDGEIFYRTRGRDGSSAVVRLGPVVHPDGSSPEQFTDPLLYAVCSTVSWQHRAIRASFGDPEVPYGRA